MSWRSRTPWLRVFDESGNARANLVCFPYAAGAATAFRRLSAMLADDVQTLAVQYPGRQERFSEPALDSIDDIAEAVFREAVVPQRPTVLFGHSMGAAVAFEVASRMEGCTRPVAGLVVSARPVPSHLPASRLHLVSDPELLESIRGLGAPNVGALDDEGLAQAMLPTIRADYRAIERYYRPEAAPVSCPLLVLVGEMDPLFSVEQAREWARYSTSSCEVHEYPGGHFVSDANLVRVAAGLRRFIVRSL